MMNTETVNNIVDISVEKKRGRKSKATILQIENKVAENIVIAIENEEKKPKPQRKKKEQKENDVIIEVLPRDIVIEKQVNMVELLVEEDDSKKTSVKKRGRKPKGGKIIQQIIPNNNLKESKPNIILHLKCSSKDLVNNNSSNTNQEIESYSFITKNDLGYELIQSKVNNTEHSIPAANTESVSDSEPNCKMKDIWNKLKELEHNFHEGFDAF